MKCDRCGKPSVYHSTLIVNGVSQSRNLCRGCALKEGVFSDEPKSMFDDMFSIFSDLLPFERVDNIVCPVCKTSLKEYKMTHQLGCPNCYETFRLEVENVVKKISQFDEHKPSLIKPKQTAIKPSKDDKIASLRQDMALAVREERYEDAAKIKKQIAKLEAENE